MPPRNDIPSASSITTSTPVDKPAPPAKKEPRFQFKPVKAALTLSPNAVAHIREILDQPEPKLVRVGVKNRGCAGLAYHLEYVDKPGKFDEIVEQDGQTP
jgi:iron-sulfur cluster assembly 1